MVIGNSFILDDGYELVSGDVAKDNGTDEILEENKKEMASSDSSSSYKRDTKVVGRWKDGVVPYTIANSFREYIKL